MSRPDRCLPVFACCAALTCQTYISGLEKSVERADETAAVSALHTVVTAQRTYGISNSGGCATFPQLVKAGALDQRFDSETPKVKGCVLAMSVLKGIRHRARLLHSERRSRNPSYKSGSAFLLRLVGNDPRQSSRSQLQPPIRRVCQ